jgi:hypothetical protein
MLVPKLPNSTPRRHLFRHLVWLVLVVAGPLYAARGPEPSLRIPLDPLGFQPLSAQFLLNGSSMLTLHYVDDHHLLVTFSIRRLMKRLPDEPKDDQDRNIDAILLELPSGHILARTSWRLHDHGQYLWSLGRGHFLLRVRDTLTSFAPLANLSSGEPFAETPFLAAPDRTIASISVSPDADLMVVQTLKRTPPAPKPVTPLFGPTPPAEQPFDPDPVPVQINFYRLYWSNDTVRPTSAGAVHSKTTGSVPVTTAGYLATIDQGRRHWAFDFHSYAGRVHELSPFDSTCQPAPLFVSHSEFIAFGCHSGQSLHTIGGFNMRGEEMWEQNLFGDYIALSLAYAPAQGRFALSRILTRSSLISDQPLSREEISSQSVVVYQTGTGRQLLRAECSPIARAGQNFALSPDGMALAVVHADAIEIYSLPPLTTKEESTVKLAQTSAPEENGLPVHFTVQPISSSTETDSATADTPPPVSQPSNSPTRSSLNLPPAQPDAPAPVAANQPSGDAPPEQPRKRPTLYTLPTDKVLDPESSQAEPPQTESPNPPQQ